MISYENKHIETSSNELPVDKNESLSKIRHLEQQVTKQQQQIQDLESSLRKLKTELRNAVSAFNLIRNRNR